MLENSYDAPAALIDRARVFATAAHAAIDQRRKYTGRPYIEHPTAVAGMVAASGGDAAMVAAAWLHDVVEDTAISLQVIEAMFGPDVGALVDVLSDLQTPDDGNRATRKRRAAERLARAGGRAQTIKYADLIHNTASIVAHDPQFAKVYLREKRVLLEVMHEGDVELRDRAWQTLETAWARLLQAR